MALFYIALCIPLLPALLAILKWPQMNSAQRWFATLLWLIVLISFSGRIWTLVRNENNLPFYYIYILIEFIILLQIFRFMFGKGLKDRSWIYLGSIFTVIWLLNVFTGEGWRAFPDWIRALESILILAIVFLWFLKLLREKIVLYPYRTFEFWICTGLLIFFSGNFLLFVFSEYVSSTENEVFKAIWKVNAILNILLYLMYTVALLWVKKTVK